MILFTGDNYVSSFNTAIRLPETPDSWLENVFIAFIPTTPSNVTPGLRGPTRVVAVC